MINHKFKVGVVVYLNSNPEIKMTILKVINNSQAVVIYFLLKIRHADNYPLEMLTLDKNVN